MAADPASPLACEVRDGWAWTRDAVDPAALAEQLVTTTDADPDDLAMRCATGPAVPDGLALRIEVGPAHVAVSVRHLVADASVSSTFAIGLPLAAFGGSLPDNLVMPSTRGITRATVRVLARHAFALARAPRGLPDTTAAASWSLDPAATNAVYDDTVRRGIGAGARRLGVRRSTLVVSLFERALRDHGLAAPHDRRTMVIDCRHYLPSGVRVRGNFVAGATVAAPWTDPVAADAKMKAMLGCARPLASMVVNARSRVTEVEPTAPTGQRLLAPDYSVVGLLRDAHRLPWQGTPTCVGGSRVLTGASCGVNYLEVGRYPQITVTHDQGWVSREQVGALLDTFGNLARRAGNLGP